MEMQVFTPTPNIAYCFFTRQGGVSTGEFDSLNTSFSTKDLSDNIIQNRQIILDTIHADTLCTVSQIHSTLCITAESALETITEADALITEGAGKALGVMGADCTPVLFYDPQKMIIAAAHAGWKGALNGVLENTIIQMRERGADHIIAQIGPCIGPKSYEVDRKFKDNFTDHNPKSALFFKPSRLDGHFMFDLPAYCAWRLQTMSVDARFDHWQDTYTNPDLFFSHRRMTHEKRKNEGRQMSVIICRNTA